MLNYYFKMLKLVLKPMTDLCEIYHTFHEKKHEINQNFPILVLHIHPLYWHCPIPKLTIPCQFSKEFIFLQ